MASAILNEATQWYLSTSGDPEVAERWFSGFRVALESLTTDPDSFPLARESDDLKFELRELHYGSGRRRTHRALFRISDNAVEVLTIRHAAQRDVTADDLGL
jgi:plasmid stabilization system protein ParE